jgi:hypothetical protein
VQKQGNVIGHANALALRGFATEQEVKPNRMCIARNRTYESEERQNRQAEHVG